MSAVNCSYTGAIQVSLCRLHAIIGMGLHRCQVQGVEGSPLYRDECSVEESLAD